MGQPVGRGVVVQPYVATITRERSLLLASSGVVRKCDKETMMMKLKKRMTKWD